MKGTLIPITIQKSQLCLGPGHMSRGDEVLNIRDAVTDFRV